MWQFRCNDFALLYSIAAFKLEALAPLFWLSLFYYSCWGSSSLNSSTEPTM